MQKLTNLFRLKPANRRTEMRYLVKRALKRPVSDAERLVNEYYFHLIRFNAIQKGETTDSYFAYYRDWNISVRLRKRPSSDMEVFWQLFLLEEYKPVVEAYRRHFGDPLQLNVIDAGANIGLMSVYLSLFFKGGKYICVEPDDANFQSLEANLQANGLGDAITVRAGIWSKNTSLKIVNDFRDKKDWSIRVEETSAADGLPAYTVQELMRRYDMPIVDILKIDIEGSEKEIFGSVADQSFLAATKCIAIEIHDEFDCRDRIYDVLRQYGFDFFEAEDLTIGINQNFL